MDTVTESYMAAAMAALGGIGIIHYNLLPSHQAYMVRSIKSRRVPILSNPVFMSPDSRVLNQFQEYDALPYVLVTKSGTASSKLIGYALKSDWMASTDKEAKLATYMHNISDSNVCLPWSYELGQCLPGSYELGQIDAYFRNHPQEENDFVILENKGGEAIDVIMKQRRGSCFFDYSNFFICTRKKNLFIVTNDVSG